ncbi:hypothetical protein ACOMHN_018951 [Nucella lapillus]
MAEGILDGVETSRRFVLILSPAYLQTHRTHWTQFSFDQAYLMMLQRKMKIVPVILEDFDMPEDISATLRCVIQATTCLRYPGPEASQRKLDTFWKRLCLCLPKKQPQNGDGQEGGDNPGHGGGDLGDNGGDDGDDGNPGNGGDNHDNPGDGGDDRDR